jgi:hypothetical protein
MPISDKFFRSYSHSNITKGAMRSLILIFLFSACLGFSRDGLQQTSVSNTIGSHSMPITIEILVTQTTSYCGGISPPPELIRELKTPRPLAGKKIVIKKGDKNTFDSAVLLAVSSDSIGHVRVQLPYGKYLIVDEFKKDTSYFNQLLRIYSIPTSNYSAIQKECLQSWYEQPDLIFEIGGGTASALTVNFQKPCSWNEIPCLEFKGPLPH